MKSFSSEVMRLKLLYALFSPLNHIVLINLTINGIIALSTKVDPFAFEHRATDRRHCCRFCPRYP